MEITSIQQLNKVKSCHYNKVTKLSLKSFYGKRLEKVPMCIRSFENLESLDLSWNRLTTLSYSIDYLVKLKSLDLSWNTLRTLSDGIVYLTSLQSLNLNYSGLTRLPESFYKISRHCYIKTNSEALLNNLPNNLEYLCFENLELPLENLPSSLIELKLKDCKINIDKIKLPYGCKLIRV